MPCANGRESPQAIGDRRDCKVALAWQAANRRRRVPSFSTGKQEAKIIAMRLGKPPKGFSNWSLRLLSERVVELGLVDSISHETVRQTLKKNGMTQRKIQYWVIPPETDAEFVACMEEVLDTYEEPYRRGVSGALYGRAAGATSQGNSNSNRCHKKTSGPNRLRIRTLRHGQHFHVH